MIDIDYRYVMRDITDQLDYAVSPVKGCVLQWRKQVLNGGRLEWTDWQDVRVEEE